MKILNTHSRAQRGWSLVEATVVLMLVGLMSAGVWKTMEVVGKNGSAQQTRDVTTRAEDALFGMLLRDLHLPMPDDARQMPQRPDHWVGWLPVSVLGTEPPRSIPYMVDNALVTPPSAVLYRSDPLNLLGTQGPPPRTAANGLDLCFRLVQRSQAPSIDGMGLAFGVQQSDQRDPAADPEFRMPFDSADDQQLKRAPNFRAAGHLELVSRLACIKGFARLAKEVRSAAMFNDLYTIAQINTDLKALELQAAGQFLRSHKWRYIVATTQVVTLAVKSATNLLAMQTTPAGVLSTAKNAVPLAIAISLWADLMQLSQLGIEGNEAEIPVLRAAHAQARDYADSLAAQRDVHLSRVNLFQAKGLRPLDASDTSLDPSPSDATALPQSPSESTRTGSEDVVVPVPRSAVAPAPQDGS